MDEPLFKGEGMENMNKVRTFSCGRGFHYIFIGGALPTHTGQMIYTKCNNKAVVVTKEIVELTNFFSRVKAMFKQHHLSNSQWFSETTRHTVGDV